MVLAWLVLSVGAASAAPILHPQSLEIVCSSAGEVRLVSKTDDGHSSPNASHWECAMCLPFSAPPTSSQAAVVSAPAPTDLVLRPVETAYIATFNAAPLPARGPPRFF